LPPPTLTVSIVTYRPDLAQLTRSLRKLALALAMARRPDVFSVNLVSSTTPASARSPKR
jgi:hypothetical protein